MNTLKETKELMKNGCEKAFAVHRLKLNHIVAVKDCDENGESLELERNISELVPIIEQKLVFDPEKPIECPLNSSINKYLEFSVKNRKITLCNLSNEECKRIEGKISPLLEKYSRTIRKPTKKMNYVETNRGV